MSRDPLEEARAQREWLDAIRWLRECRRNSVDDATLRAAIEDEAEKHRKMFPPSSR